MTGNFEKCLEYVLHHEGGFVDHPQDPGGATNLGCTKATWEKWIGRPCTVAEIKALTPDDVATGATVEAISETLGGASTAGQAGRPSFCKRSSASRRTAPSARVRSRPCTRLTRAR